VPFATERRSQTFLRVVSECQGTFRCDIDLTSERGEAQSRRVKEKFRAAAGSVSTAIALAASLGLGKEVRTPSGPAATNGDAVAAHDMSGAGRTNAARTHKDRVA
jgi:hypothetical protein